MSSALKALPERAIMTARFSQTYLSPLIFGVRGSVSHGPLANGITGAQQRDRMDVGKRIRCVITKIRRRFRDAVVAMITWSGRYLFEGRLFDHVPVTPSSKVTIKITDITFSLSLSPGVFWILLRFLSVDLM